MFVQPPREKKKPGVVWKLLKPAYGLRDASRQWFFSTVETLISLGMEQSLNDSCLFVYRRNKKIEGILIFHVDDFLSAGSEYFEKNVMGNVRHRYEYRKI